MSDIDPPTTEDEPVDAELDMDVDALQAALAVDDDVLGTIVE